MTQNHEAVLAISSRTWLSYYFQNRFHLAPLSYDSLEFASGFASEQCPEGVVAIASNTLRILALEKLGAVFNQVSYPLEYTPRKFVVHDSGRMIIIETDHNAYTLETKLERRQQIAQEMRDAATEEEQELAHQMADAFLNEDLPESEFGAPKAGAGMWASIVRIMDPTSGNSLHTIRLPQNEAALSIGLARFMNQDPEDYFVLVGVAKDLKLNPKQCDGGFIYTYK
jgi:splicing factor 3B subunit 3